MSDLNAPILGWPDAANDNPIAGRRAVASLVLTDVSPLPMEGFLAMIRRVRASVGQMAAKGFHGLGGVSDDAPLFVGGLTLADVPTILSRR
jgi:hypothetical protein